MGSDLWLRLRSFFKPDAIDRELDEELTFHLEERVAAAVSSGMARGEAERIARIELGGVEQIKEEHRDARGIRFVADLARDIRYAFRAFGRLPGFASITLLMLALGIAATTVMYTVIDGVLLKPLPYPTADRLVTLHGRSDTIGESWGFSYPDFLDVERQSRSLSLAAWTYGAGTISAPGEPAYVDGRQISADLFAVLNVHLARGRTFLPEEDRLGGPPVAIVSYSLWQRRFGGDDAAIGQPLILEGMTYMVVGVAPADFNLAGEAAVFIPLGQNPQMRMQNRGARFIHVLGRLEPSASLKGSRTELALVGQRLATQFPATDAGRELIARPLLGEVVGDAGSMLWLLLAAVSIVLVVACVNVASLLLARTQARENELATRLALGASRGRVVRQCLTENAVLGLLGGALGVPLAMAAIRPFVALWPGSLPRSGEVQLDWRVLLMTIVVSLASGVTFGLAPALRIPTGNLEEVLRACGRSIVRSSRRLHSAFVVAQIALAVVLLVSATTLARTLVMLSSLDPGLNVHNLVAARIALSPGFLTDPAQMRAAWSDAVDRVRHVPGVESVALTDIVPMRAGENSLPYSATPVARPSTEMPIALASTVTPDYLTVMGIPLRSGRFFDEHDRLGGEPVVVIDEQLALHAFGRQDVAGRQLWVPALGSLPLRIIGVVGHVRHWGLANDDQSRVRDQMYYSFDQVPPGLLRLFSSLMSIAIRTKGAPLDVIAPVQSELRGNETIYEIRTMEQLVSTSLARHRFLALLFGIFGAVAMLLACVGVYGVLAFLTSQRTAEFGVRVAFGSTASDIIRLVMRQSAAFIAVGLTIGAGAAWSAGRVIESLVKGTEPTGPLTFVATTSVLAAAALWACFLPARHAARVDAVQALRNN
jgi:putative ABC transport system permease protein